MKIVISLNNSIRPRIIFVFLCCIPGFLFSQTKFDPQQLPDYKTNGAKIAALLNTIEVPEYSDTLPQCMYLKNGLRSSKFINESEWLSIKDKVEPYRIDVVYSKYPLRKGVYNEIYPLLLSRLQSLFQLDPYLNDRSIEWNKVLQTNCINDKQVQQLFHGVVIWYRTEDLKAKAEEKKELEKAQQVETERKSAKKSLDQVESVKISKSNDDKPNIPELEQNTLEEIEQSISNIKSFSFVSDSLVKILSTQSLQEQMNTIKKFIEEDIANDPEISLKEATKEELLMYNKEIEDFLVKFPARDSVVMKVFDRHPEWKNVLVINDWTGSMYGYGAQVLLWHLNHFEKSGIISITLFNDGDSKNNYEKKIGETGGIYFEHPDNILTLKKTFNYVMLQGMGGDYEENDVEAILKAMEETPRFSEIVLIADNNACIRDIELTHLIDKPVKIILCGYNPSKGINPDLVYLAKKTGGGIYTITEDIENIKIEYDSLGREASILEGRFRLSEINCSDNRTGEKNKNDLTLFDRYDIKLENEINTDLKYARFHKNKINELILKDSTLSEIPTCVYNMDKITYLNMSNNRIDKISPEIKKLEYLRVVNLSHNRLKNIPLDMKSILFIENLNLSYNKLTTIPSSVLGMKFLISLDISHNQLTKFDNNIQLRKLENLDISNNKFKELSKEIGLMKNLTILNASDNLLTSLPNGLTNLANLRELNLKNNQLTELPLLLFKLKKLKILHLENNNFQEEEKNRIRGILSETKVYF